MTEEEKSGPLVEGKITVTDVFGLGKAADKLTPAATKLIEVISGGLGKIYEPASIYLNARAGGAANRQVAIKDAQAYSAALLEHKDPVILDAMRDRILGREYQRQVNIGAVEAKAVEIAQESVVEDASPVDPDFMVEWTESVKDVSNEQLQSLWAHLLAAAPIQEGGRVPKPALDLLKLFDPAIAKEFEALLDQCVFQGNSLPDFFAQGVIGDYAEEVGIGTYKKVQTLTVKGEFINLEVEGTELAGFNVFQVGARANQLARLVMPQKPDVDFHARFLADMQEILSVLFMGPHPSFILKVTDRNSWTTKYRMYGGIKEGAEEGTIAQIKSLKLPGVPKARKLRSRLLAMAKQGECQFLEQLDDRIPF